MLLGFDIGGTKCALILGSTNERERIDITDKAMLPTNSCSTFFNTGSGQHLKTVPVSQVIQSQRISVFGYVQCNTKKNGDGRYFY
jgi:hypothetical protein